MSITQRGEKLLTKACLLLVLPISGLAKLVFKDATNKKLFLSALNFWLLNKLESIKNYLTVEYNCFRVPLNFVTLLLVVLSFKIFFSTNAILLRILNDFSFNKTALPLYFLVVVAIIRGWAHSLASRE